MDASENRRRRHTSLISLVLGSILTSIPPFCEPPAVGGEADTTPRAKSVRIVYLVSADKTVREDYRKGIETAAKDLQSWYAKQLGGPTFRLNEPVVEVVKSDKKADWFYGHPDGDNKDDWGFNDEAAQAEYAVNFHRVCFAHPAMRAITWWDLGDQGSFIPGGGMLREDLSPKPVYEQLKRLIHEEWKTRASGTTDGAGRFSFRGFLGTYKVVTAIQGKTIEKQFHLEKGTANEMTVSLP
jgi:hypothetical protein